MRISFPKHDTYWQIWVNEIYSYFYRINCICAVLSLRTLFMLKYANVKPKQQGRKWFWSTLLSNLILFHYGGVWTLQKVWTSFINNSLHFATFWTSCLYWIVMFHHVLLLNIINDQLWRIRQAGHVACTRKKRNTHNFGWKKRHHFEHLGIGRRITLKWISWKQDQRTQFGFIWLRTVTGDMAHWHIPFFWTLSIV